MRPDLRQYEVWARTRVHRERVARARAILVSAAAVGPLVVSTSWGKDSVALCDLAIDTLGSVPMLHLASPYGLPGYEEVVAHFAARTEVHVLEARRSLAEYIQWCREVGLPHERTRSQQNAVVTNIKRDRAAEWVAERGYVVQVMGLRIEEGGPRKRVLKSRGPLYQLVDGTWRCCPLAYWSVKDVWAWIVTRGLPYNRRIYDAETHGETRETIRNTGWLSTDGADRGRIAWLERHFPEQYRLLAAEFSRVEVLR